MGKSLLGYVSPSENQGYLWQAHFNTTDIVSIYLLKCSCKMKQIYKKGNEKEKRL